ncbi:carboxypeptidase regulatory-like domain-containing protein [Actinokineospora guangxiensis]|uniref:Carboxypeptidase regulatory-like domain-containing protein n=1 Tax=Actinokineospora guangxiensis TaxID=1490288 RepID=A0ABW0ESI8_9PSEU
MSPRPHQGRARTWLAAVTTAVAASALLAPPALAAPAGTDAKIEPQLLSALDAKDSADFWVLFGTQADLSPASKITDWTAKGKAVLDALKSTADKSQAAVRADLDAAKVDYDTYFIANAVHVKNGTQALAESLAKRGEVADILAPRTYKLPELTPGQVQATVDAVEWGVADIRADDAWDAFGTRGEGIVVANIDSGVQFDHPALVGKYRGNNGGAFDHQYNWFDPSDICPGDAPCDNNGHGTHTMGTMVGSEGANQVGVAPNARWIAAKGCESSGCSESALLSSGQWILAPTDTSGANPRPDLRPHIVNNSWGAANGATVDPWYKATVQAWRAAGIFPSFSNGNSGPGCNTAGSPGDNLESYASGAHDVNGAIASFSSRGPGENGEIRPSLSAPGVNVRSSLPDNTYGTANGTSMAAPHTSAAVALMWSAAPSLIGDIEQTSALLDDTAIDVNALTCGGTVDDNNVFGEGKLDAYAAVEASPRGPVGTATGTVTDSASGEPIAGASVTITGPTNRSLSTAANGTYSSTLPVGDYSVAATAFGYAQATATLTVTEGQSATVNLALTSAPRAAVTGSVRNAQGAAVAGASVQILGTPIAATTSDAEGAYSFAGVPHGTYQVRATAGGCNDPSQVELVVDGAETLNIVLPARGDSFGHHCVLEPSSYVEGDTAVALTGDDAAASVALPFDFFYYGGSYREAHVSTNGHINFQARSTVFSNVAIPASAAPNAAIYPFWDDLVIDAQSQILTKAAGTAPNRAFTIEWRNATVYQQATTRVDFSVTLSESGEIAFSYRNLDAANPRETGNSATVGIENATGTVALQYSLNAPTLANETTIRFRPPASGTVSGEVTDANDRGGIEGASVKVLNGAATVATTTTDAEGDYALRLLAGTYTVEVAKQHYVTVTEELVVDGAEDLNVALNTPRAELTGGPLSFLGQEGQLRAANVTLASTADLPVSFTLADSAPWLWAVPGSASVAPGASRVITVRVDPTGLEPGVHEGSVTLTTNAGRTPTLTIPVELVVPAYRTGVDVGGPGLTDRNSDAWVGDQQWTPGGFGYLSAGPVVTSKKAIAGTDEDALFQTQRESAGGYRFDDLPAGTYQVELGFAELRASLAAGKRVFDVSVNGTKVLANYDIVARVGTLAADSHTFWVTVPEGGSISVSLAALRGKSVPVINTLRVTHRPDRTS